MNKCKQKLYLIEIWHDFPFKNIFILQNDHHTEAHCQPKLKFFSYESIFIECHVQGGTRIIVILFVFNIHKDVHYQKIPLPQTVNAKLHLYHAENFGMCHVVLELSALTRLEFFF